MPEHPFNLLTHHIRISRETFERLSLYHDLLVKWQEKINLVSSDTIHDAWHRHFLDSLQLLPHLRNLSSTMIDLGSGAGFPGMVIAIAGASDVHLIESDGRKVVFLEEVARITKTELTIHHGRIERAPVKKCEVILSRACSDLDHLIKLSAPFISHETICLFHKGKNYFKEIEEAKKRWLFEYAVLSSLTENHGVILSLSNVREKDHGGKQQ